MFDKQFAVSFLQTSGIFEFINRDLNSVFGVNKLFQDDYVYLYLRNHYKYIPAPKKNRVLEYNKQSAISIANISIPESFQRQGLGGSLINVIHESHNKQRTFVELAHTDYLRAWLIREEWTRASKHEPTYYKVKSQPLELDKPTKEEE